MGANQSTAAGPTRTDHTWVKKKESTSLQKSRAKYLSQALRASESNLTAIGRDSSKGAQTGEYNNGILAAGITENSEAEQKNSMGNVTDIELEFTENKDTTFGEVIEQELVPLLETEKPKSGTKEIGTAAPIKKGGPSFQPLGRNDRSASLNDEVDVEAATVQPKDYRFLFETLVFEGGGNKGLAYCGAVRVAVGKLAEHYRELYSRENVVTDTDIENTTTLPTMVELDAPPTIEKLRKAIDSLSCGKAPGSDGIPPEIVKAGKESSLLGHLHDLLLQCWEEGTIPQDMRDAKIVMLYKNKGDHSDCNNCCGIYLLSIVGKLSPESSSAASSCSPTECTLSRSVGFEQIGRRLTWSSLSGSYRKSAVNRDAPYFSPL